MPDALLSVGFARDHDADLARLQVGADCIGVIGLVGEELLDPGNQLDAVFRHGAIGGVAGGQDERPRPQIFVDKRVYLAVSAALRDPDRLKESPPFPPPAQRCALTWELSKATSAGGSGSAAGQAASLAGLAPVARQSGRWTGRAFIRGGRASLRRALYMPALVAARFNADMKAKYEQLIKAGKPAKVALTALMRKLIVLANALLEKGRLWAQNPA